MLGGATISFFVLVWRVHLPSFAQRQGYMLRSHTAELVVLKCSENARQGSVLQLSCCHIAVRACVRSVCVARQRI